MVRSNFARGTLIALVAIIIAAASYWSGAYAQRKTETRDFANVQAMLAFGHHKSYAQIESLIVRKCYEAALTDARELKNLQVRLVFDNLHLAGNDPELVEYMRLRDPQMLEAVLAGRVPELKPYTTTCPQM